MGIPGSTVTPSGFNTVDVGVSEGLADTDAIGDATGDEVGDGIGDELDVAVGIG